MLLVIVLDKRMIPLIVPKNNIDLSHQYTVQRTVQAINRRKV